MINVDTFICVKYFYSAVSQSVWALHSDIWWQAPQLLTAPLSSHVAPHCFSCYQIWGEGGDLHPTTRHGDVKHT